MKTKAQELDLLRALATELGPQSYLGPWILDVLPEIEADIRADLPPVVSWSDLRGLHAAAIEDAKKYRKATEQERQRILDAALEDARKIRASAAADLRKALIAVDRTV